MCYFTQQGIQDLRMNHENLCQKYRILYQQHLSYESRINLSPGNKDVGDSSPEHLDMERQLQILQQQILQMAELLRKAVLVEEPRDADRLRIGHIVIIQRLTVDGQKIGKSERYLIGGHQSTDLKATPPILSYDSPIIAQHLGRRIGNSFELQLGGRRQVSELLKIEMPSAAVKLRAVG